MMNVAVDVNKMTEMPSFDVTERLAHVDVLCVARSLNYILAGAGSDLLVYDNQTLVCCHPIFLGERIHSICTQNDSIVVKGGRQLALCKLEKIQEKLNCTCISIVQCSDWVQDVIKISGNVVGLITAHNSFEIWDFNLKRCMRNRSFEEKCILYSSKIIGNTFNNIIVFSGTVFGEICIWAPFLNDENCVLQRIKAHNGAVFSIEVNISEKILASTSDDRSLKIWVVETSEPLISPEQWLNVKIQLAHTLYGHAARVWKSLIISDFFVTIGEDSQLMVWRRNGVLIKKLSLHQYSGIRGLCYSEAADAVITGGEDGSINVISWNYLTSDCDVTEFGKAINAEKSFSTKVCFVKNGFVYTTIGGVMLVNGKEEELIYSNENFLTYCTLEVSSGGDFIALGSIKGHIVIINVETKSVVIDGKYVNGRIYAMHSLGSLILTCGPDGELHLWKPTLETLEHFKSLTLPVSKERWTTCCLISQKNLVVGDRMGNVHVYDLNAGGEPIHTFWKIHSYSGVTDIFNDGNVILTIGRDGTLKTFSHNFVHLNSYKLPMEWPWKIIKYKDSKLILGFHGVDFVVWSMTFRDIIASQECGGGHRSCHFKIFQNKLKLVYTKEKKISVIDLALDNIRGIRNGFHGKNINAMQFLRLNPIVVVSGSEDTTLRISKLGYHDVEAIHVLKTHLSNIRTISTYYFDDGNVLIMSAGGKAQIVLWEFDINYLTCEELVNYTIKTSDHNWKCTTPAQQADTRFMCADISKKGNEFLIAAGCSDCQLRLYSFNKEDLTLLLSTSCSCCILNVSFLKSASSLYVLTMGTNGHVVFWNFDRHLLKMTKSDSFAVHQSGINSFALVEMDYSKYILFTGGDDNKICASAIQLSGKGVVLNELWANSNTHACQVTGIKVFKNFVATTSIDQRITLWKWCYANNEFEMEFVNQWMTVVPDVQGMDVRWCPNNQLVMVVYGKGFEMLKIDINSKLEPALSSSDEKIFEQVT